MARDGSGVGAGGIRGIGLLLVCLALAPAAAGSTEDPAWRPPSGIDTSLPAGLGELLAARPELASVWLLGVEAERQEELLESTRHYEQLVSAAPGSAFLRWRISRNLWRHGERLPLDEKLGRTRFFERCEEWADSALAIDATCGECVFWKLSCLGRQVTTNRVRAAARAAEIRDLIEFGISLRPVHRDNERNATLGNLYYAGSAFYRIVPDWFWLEWVIGVRGDPHRALDYIRKALAFSDSRVDYQVELGAVLLCIAARDGDLTRLSEGQAALRHALELDPFQKTDRIDAEHARVLLDEPERACGYSRDGWIEVDEAAVSLRGLP